MKRIFGIVLLLSLISCERISSPVENKSCVPVNLRMGEYPTVDSIFTVENYTNVNIGIVMIRLADSTNASVNVPDSGSFSTKISNAPVSCLIRGRELPYATPTWIEIDAHIRIHATWVSNVIIVDTDEQS